MTRRARELWTRTTRSVTREGWRPALPKRHLPARPRAPRKNGGMTHDGDRWLVTCSTCGASRDGLDDGTLCPSCGSTAKTVHVSFHEEVAVATESFGITAVYEKHRPWQEKWHEVEAAYDALTEVYGGSVPDGPEKWKAIALSFFRACHELSDAIAGDTSLSPATTRNVRTAAHGDDALTLIADVDNTRKHGGRDPGKCHAHVGEISWGDHGTPTMTVLRECPSSSVERVDVGDAATAAMAAWRAILSRHGLTP